MKHFPLLLLACLTVTLGCFGGGSKGTGISAPASAPGDPAPSIAFSGTAATGPEGSTSVTEASPREVFAPTGDAPRIEEFGIADIFRIHYQDGGDQYLTTDSKRWLTIPPSGVLPVRIWVDWKDWNLPDVWHQTVDGDRLRFVFKPFHPAGSARTSCDIVLSNTGGKLGETRELALLLPPYGPDLNVVEGDLEIYYFIPLVHPEGGFIVPGNANDCAAGLAPFGSEETYQALRAHRGAKYIGTFGLTLPAIL